MPLVDLPLVELHKYQGINPRPADFDEYWDKGMAEMKAIDPEIEIVPSDFQVPFAECFHLYFTGVGGARIHAKYVRPKHATEPHPAIIQFHGYSADSGEWPEKLAYAALGFSVFAMDCRGQAGRSEDVSRVTGYTFYGHIIRGLEDHPERLLFRQVFLDAAQLAGIVMTMPEVNPQRVGAMGGSQGGALSIVCAALEPRIQKLALSYPFLSDYRRIWEMDLAVRAYEELKHYFTRFDPQHEREEEIFAKLGYIDIQHLAKRIKGTVLMGVGLMDTSCPPSTQFAVYNKILSPKRLEIYPDFGHEHLPHFWEKTMMFMLES